MGKSAISAEAMSGIEDIELDTTAEVAALTDTQSDDIYTVLGSEIGNLADRLEVAEQELQKAIDDGQDSKAILKKTQECEELAIKLRNMAMEGLIGCKGLEPNLVQIVQDIEDGYEFEED